VHFWPILNEEQLAIRASVALQNSYKKTNASFFQTISNFNMSDLEGLVPSNPLQEFGLMGGRKFEIRLIASDQDHIKIFDRQYDSDSIGNFDIKIPLEKSWQKIRFIEVFEMYTHPGIEINLGTYMPIEVNHPRNLVISDFDKTLVDTRYSTGKEVFYSLTRPIQYFPSLTGSVEIFKNYISKGYRPFILSASPHFYENAMRDWLLQNKIYGAAIFLKDYRLALSFFEGALRPKDLKVHGLYKLNHLLDIIAMTGIPENLILMGDNFESDPVIYLTFCLCLKTNIEPWQLWNYVKRLESFQLSRRQDSLFLNKIFQLKNQQKRFLNTFGKTPNVTIYIRKKGQEQGLEVGKIFEEVMPSIVLYDGRIEGIFQKLQGDHASNGDIVPTPDDKSSNQQKT